MSGREKPIENGQMSSVKMNESEPLKKCRKRETSAKLTFQNWVGIKIMDTCNADYLRNGIKVA